MSDEQIEFDLSTEIVVKYPLLESSTPSWNLPNFTQSRCRMCGGEPRFRFHDRVEMGEDCYRIYRDEGGPEYEAVAGVFPKHLHRFCSTCHYSWVEKTLEDSGMTPEDLD